MARGNDGQPVFLDTTDYNRFLRLLIDARERFACRIHAYCLMPNHFHLLLRTTGIPLSPIMQWILTCYVHRFNKNRERTGHLFQSRFKAISCNNDRYFLALLRYIHLNPVSAQQAQSAADWPWTGHRELSGAEKARILDISFPLGLFNPEVRTAMAQYSQFIATAPEDMSSPFIESSSESSQEITLQEEAGPPEDADSKTSLIEIADAVSRDTGLSREVLLSTSRVRTIAHAKWLVARRAISHGFNPSAIAAFLHCSPSVISKALNTSFSLKYGKYEKA